MTTALVLVDLQVAFGAPVARLVAPLAVAIAGARGRRPRPARVVFTQHGHHDPALNETMLGRALGELTWALRARDADLAAGAAPAAAAASGRAARAAARAGDGAARAPGDDGLVRTHSAEWALHPAFARLARRRDRRGGEAEAAGGLSLIHISEPTRPY